MAKHRVERDSMGEVQVPEGALYGAQTQRAVDNFKISGMGFPRVFIRAIGLVKYSAASANEGLGLLDKEKARWIKEAALEASEGVLDEHFVVDIFQTGSGTSTNMNTNEVIARRAELLSDSKVKIHPNDDVNKGQSSNDVIPTAIHVAAAIEAEETLLPGLEALRSELEKRAAELKDVVKTGRTHLMDAMPVTMGQEIGGWAAQISDSIFRVKQTLPAVKNLAIGGTAVGTGINTHPGFSRSVCANLTEKTGITFLEAQNHFSAQSAMDAAVELSGQLKTSASALMKIANDLRFQNSGPIAGFSEITLGALQPGSSIMPGKINPVVCESSMMASAQVIGNDTTIAVSNALGNFQLNVMLPVIAKNLLESITILGNSARMLAEKGIRTFTVNREKIDALIGRNPVLVTTLAPIIGYDNAAGIVKKAYKEGRAILEVAKEMTELKEDELKRLLDAKKMTEGGYL